MVVAKTRRWLPAGAVVHEAAERAGQATGWTGRHLRHVTGMIRQGGNPAARVYESIGSECFLALAPGWLNLGLWEGPGTEAEAEAACRRLVQAVASALPVGGVIVDVGNGLGTQDPLIAESTAARRLVAVNIAEWQLAAGRDRLREAAAAPVHFRSRRAFFAECYRVLRPGGVLSITDISTERWPRGPAELASGLAQLRVFGLRPGAAMTAGQIAAAARAAGLVDVEVTRCGDRVIAPALRVIAARLAGSPPAPLGHRTAARFLLWQVELLWRHRIIDYLLLRAARPR
jgi:SAM-dependent methyltransferase